MFSPEITIDYTKSFVCNPTRCLSDEQKIFLREHDIHISGAYVGMVRAYRNNKVIWQTSCMENMIYIMSIRRTVSEERLFDELNKWISHMMTLPKIELEKIFEQNIGLLQT